MRDCIDIAHVKGVLTPGLYRKRGLNTSWLLMAKFIELADAALAPLGSLEHAQRFLRYLVAVEGLDWSRMQNTTPPGSRLIALCNETRLSVARAFAQNVTGQTNNNKEWTAYLEACDVPHFAHFFRLFLETGTTPGAQTRGMDAIKACIEKVVQRQPRYAPGTTGPASLTDSDKEKLVNVFTASLNQLIHMWVLPGEPGGLKSVEHGLPETGVAEEKTTAVDAKQADAPAAAPEKNVPKSSRKSSKAQASAREKAKAGHAAHMAQRNGGDCVPASSVDAAAAALEAVAISSPSSDATVTKPADDREPDTPTRVWIEEVD